MSMFQTDPEQSFAFVLAIAELQEQSVQSIAGDFLRLDGRQWRQHALSAVYSR